MVRAYELLSERGDWPLHLGVTEAGPAFQGTIKSATAFGALLSKGIGDTIRVSLSAPPVEEVKVGIQILQSLNLRPRKLEIVSCPSCGRAQVDVYTLAERVTAGLEGMEVPLRVAVMGCVVNGPGEAREADLGVASGNGKGQIFVKGEVIKTVPEALIVETLIEEAMRLAESMDPVESGRRCAGRHRRLTSAAAERHSDRRVGHGVKRTPVVQDRPMVHRRAALLDGRAGTSGPRGRRPRAALAVCARDAVGAVLAPPGCEQAVGTTCGAAGGTLWGLRGGRRAPGRLLRRREHGPRRRRDDPPWTARSTPSPGSRAAGPALLVDRRPRRGRARAVGTAPPLLGPAARDVREDQPSMVIEHAPLVTADPRVRRSGPRSSTSCSRPASAMFTEEVGYSPVSGPGGPLRDAGRTG